MISSNILHRQFRSICSFHRKHCKEGAAVTAFCPLCYSDATMKLWMDTIRSNSQHLNSTACEPGITLSIHTHFSIYSSQTTNGTTRNLPKIVHGKTPKKRRKRELTHCSSLPAWCQRHSSPLHLPSKVSTAEVEKVEEDQREAASLHLSGMSGRDAGTEGRIPTQQPLQDGTAIPSLPSLPVMRAATPTREEEGDRTPSLLSPLHPLLQGAQCSQEPGSRPAPHPQAPVPPVLSVRPLNLLGPQALLHSH